MNLDAETMIQMGEEQEKYESFPDIEKVYMYDSMQETMMHTNKFTEEYLEYIENMDESYCKSIQYTRLVNMNMLRKDGDSYIPVTSANLNFASYPLSFGEDENALMYEHYDLLCGEMPKEPTDIILLVDSKNRINKTIMTELGYDENLTEINFSDIIGTEFKVIMNDDYFVKTEMGIYSFNTDYEAMYNSANSLTLKITGIIRPDEESPMAMMTDGGALSYNDNLAQLVIENAKNSEIVKAQVDSDVNVMSMEPMDEATKEQTIAYLGGNEIPFMISLYPQDFETKDKMLEYLDKFNEPLADEDKIIYTDTASMISGMSDGIMDGITIVLIAFAGTNLIVSLIMIAIITYTSVLERTKEIGILKALGARKKDITRVFNAETFILGVASGLLGIIVAKLLTYPINDIIFSLTELKDVAQLKISHSVILIVISTILTMIGGFIPARMASKRNAVDALRSE